MSTPGTNKCYRCEFHQQMGITLLDAKWLDPECHNGCKSIVLKNRIAKLERELAAANAEIERSAVYQRLSEIHQATVDKLTSAKSALEKARVIIREYHGILPGDEAREALTAINEVLK